MPRLDQDFAKRAIDSVGSIAPDAKPLWGKMNRAQLYGHLHLAVGYSLGHGPDMPFKGNWKSKMIFRPLILSGLVSIPKGVKLPAPKGMKTPPPPAEATLEEMTATINAFVAAAKSGSVSRRMHPFFGELSGPEWQQFHAAHFKHHMKQFGVW
jgi:oxepin-CoA hydrolase/3-oxo-5,6-dehydrosuberyl-CoA semialdehyde dehydrogenase